MLKKVSVIIPTKNEEKNISQAIKSIKKQTVKDIETIVVDNHSTDKTAQIAKKFGAKVFQAGKERSFQRNFGAGEASGNILFFVDADMEVEPTVVRETLDLSGKDLSVKGIIVPEISVGENYWARVRSLERSCYLNEPTIEAARFFDKKAFLKIGGFDENLIAAEDWDLTQRIQKLGKVSRIKAKIIHHEGKLSLLAHLKKKYYYGQNIVAYAKKHPKRFKKQSGAARIKILFKNWKKLIADPIHAVGVIVLKGLEYFVYLLTKMSPFRMTI